MVRLERCCCCCNVRTGTLILGWLSLIGCIAAVGSYASQLSQIKQNDPDKDLKTGVFWYQIVVDSFWALAAGLLLHGVYKERPKFFMPFLISTAIQIIGNIILAVLIFINLNASEGAGASILIILNVYFFIVVWSHYKDLEEGVERTRGGYA